MKRGYIYCGSESREAEPKSTITKIFGKRARFSVTNVKKKKRKKEFDKGNWILMRHERMEENKI